MTTDWIAGVETKNYKIPRGMDPVHLRGLLMSMFCVLMIAGALIGYLWLRGRIVDMGYAVQHLKETEATLTRMENSLILEEETLKRPERIDFIARTELAMEPLSPYQRLAPRFREISSGQPAPLILANVRTTNVQPRRSSANN